MHMQHSSVFKQISALHVLCSDVCCIAEIILQRPIDGFHGAWLHFRRARIGSVFSASMCIIQASKRYVESLPLVLKNRRSCFSQGERLLYSCLLSACLPPEVGRLRWHSSLSAKVTKNANLGYSHDRGLS